MTRLFNKVAETLEKLAQMPDRVTAKDLADASNALRTADATIDKLQKGPLPGCTCRVIDDGEHSYVIYNAKCHHHASLLAREERLKADFAAAEKKLKDPYRAQLFAAALQGLLASRTTALKDISVEAVVNAAEKLADAALERLIRP